VVQASAANARRARDPQDWQDMLEASIRINAHGSFPAGMHLMARRERDVPPCWPVSGLAHRPVRAFPEPTAWLQWPVCTSGARVQQTPRPVRLPLRGQLGLARLRGSVASRFPFTPRHHELVAQAPTTQMLTGDMPPIGRRIIAHPRPARTHVHAARPCRAHRPTAVAAP
jgi:hypothetical protein